MNSGGDKNSDEESNVKKTIELLKQLLSDLKYGSLEITIHDGRIVQIEKRKKIRLDAGKKYLV